MALVPESTTKEEEAEVGQALEVEPPLPLVAAVACGGLQREGPGWASRCLPSDPSQFSKF